MLLDSGYGLAKITKSLYASPGCTAFGMDWDWAEGLVSAPALALPDITKPFHLYIDEAKSILTQALGL